MPQFMYRRKRRLAAKRFVRLQRKYKKKRKSKGSTLAAKVNKLINAQATWWDAYISISPSTSGGYTNIGLTDIIKGTSANQRIGDKIELKSISMKFFVSLLNGSALNADAFNNIRIILVQFPQPMTSGVGVLPSDVLETGDVLSHYKKDSKVKYKILFDSLYYLDNQGFGSGAASNPVWTPATTHQKRCFKDIKFPKGLSVTYNSSNVVVANDVQLLMVSDSSLTPHPNVQGRIRLNFQP